MGLGKSGCGAGGGVAGAWDGETPRSPDALGGDHLCGPPSPRSLPSLPAEPRVPPRWREPGSGEAVLLLRTPGSVSPPSARAPHHCPRPANLEPNLPGPRALVLGRLGLEKHPDRRPGSLGTERASGFLGAGEKRKEASGSGEPSLGDTERTCRSAWSEGLQRGWRRRAPSATACSLREPEPGGGRRTVVRIRTRGIYLTLQSDYLGDDR